LQKLTDEYNIFHIVHNFTEQMRIRLMQ